MAAQKQDDLEEFVAEDAVDELASLNHSNRKLRAENRRMHERLGDWRALMAAFAEAAHVLPKPRAAHIKATASSEEKEAVLLLSDMHANEVWSKRQTDGLTSYDYEKFCSTLWFLCGEVVRLVEELRPTFGLRVLHIDMLGDILHGQLRLDDEVTNEFQTVPAVAMTSYVLYQAIRLLSEHFEKVIVTAVPGNHGRLHKKPQSKRYVGENLDTLIYCGIASMLHVAGLGDRISFSVPHSRVHSFSRLGHKVKIGHGDHIKGGGGIANIPIFGLSRDILRQFRKEIKAAREGERLELIEFGHFHNSNILEDVLFLNGAFCPTGPWAMDELGAFQDPKQWFYLASRRHVYSWQMPISLKRGADATHSFAVECPGFPQ